MNGGVSGWYKKWEFSEGRLRKWRWERWKRKERNDEKDRGQGQRHSTMYQAPLDDLVQSDKSHKDGVRTLATTWSHSMSACSVQTRLHRARKSLLSPDRAHCFRVQLQTTRVPRQRGSHRVQSREERTTCQGNEDTIIRNMTHARFGSSSPRLSVRVPQAATCAFVPHHIGTQGPE